jgi:hypothetical protein
MEVIQIATKQPKRDWTTGLCACCADFKTCKLNRLIHAVPHTSPRRKHCG